MQRRRGCESGNDDELPVSCTEAVDLRPTLQRACTLSRGRPADELVPTCDVHPSRPWVISGGRDGDVVVSELAVRGERAAPSGAVEGVSPSDPGRVAGAGPRAPGDASPRGRARRHGGTRSGLRGAMATWMRVRDGAPGLASSAVRDVGRRGADVLRAMLSTRPRPLELSSGPVGLHARSKAAKPPVPEPVAEVSASTGAPPFRPRPSPEVGLEQPTPRAARPRRRHHSDGRLTLRSPKVSGAVAQRRLRQE